MLKYVWMAVMCSLLWSCDRTGCTDKDARNFDRAARDDGGSCRFIRAEASLVLIQQDSSSSGDYLIPRICYQLENTGDYIIRYHQINFDLVTEDGETYHHFHSTGDTILLGETDTVCAAFSSHSKKAVDIVVTDLFLDDL